MNNKHIILVFALISGLFMACEKEAIEKTEFSDVGWYTSHFRETHLRTLQARNSYETFVDLSQGAVDHYWMVDSGIFFMDGGLVRNQPNIEKFIKNTTDTVTSESTIITYFSYGGDTLKVRLFNTFKDSVTFRGSPDKASDEVGLAGVVGSEWSDSLGLWVIDQTFLVSVYDTLTPLIEVFDMTGDVVYQNLTDTIPNEIDTLKIKEGDFLTFRDHTEWDRPDGRSLKVYDLETDEHVGNATGGGDAKFTFNQKAKYRMVFFASRKGKSLDADGVIVPGRTDSVSIPMIVDVDFSTEPFDLNNDAREFENDGVITITSTVDLKEFTGASGFTMTINGTDATANILDVSSEGTNSILVTTDVDYDYLDEVVLSYDGSSSIKNSSEFRSLDPFSMDVAVYDENILAQAGIDWDFSNNGKGWLLDELFTARAQGQDVTVSVVDDPLGVKGKVLKITLPNIVQNDVAEAAKFKSIEARLNSDNVNFPIAGMEKDANYTISIDYYVVDEDGGDDAILNPADAQPVTGAVANSNLVARMTADGAAKNPQIFMNSYTNLTVTKDWASSTKNQAANSAVVDGVDLRCLVQLTGKGKVSVYFDNFRVIKN
ncbi:hypothetical protein [Reichenbachiella versicolor]|uniref:hypothetical protein n=1 Tax=Reichenbachiella versicolor TaxID=1821036 RepID=UPI0013A58236|nr:hypothetical protein [Reichenbachiella versicolor]